MGGPSDRDESTEPSRESGKAENVGGLRRAFREQLDALRDRRKRLAEPDVAGRTPLFYAAEKGREEEVREIIFSFGGTGMSPPRLALIAQKDALGLTAADVAEQNGHDEIAQLLRSEQGRMEFFE
jgi:ankyrin repeat protein